MLCWGVLNMLIGALYLTIKIPKSLILQIYSGGSHPGFYINYEAVIS